MATQNLKLIHPVLVEDIFLVLPIYMLIYLQPEKYWLVYVLNVIEKVNDC